jgi:hypothetical protein
MLMQTVALTIIGPLYLALHLLTSPVAKLFPGTSTKPLHVSTIDLKILPISVFLGYVIPSILMILPTPNVVSAVAHQRYIAVWQAFPICNVVAHWTIKALTGTPSKTPAPSGAAYLASANQIYTSTIVLCAVTHLPVLAITLLPSSFFPWDSAIFTTTFTNVFIPHLPLLSQKVPDLTTGVHTFLQWDVHIGLTAFVLWAFLLHRTAIPTGSSVALGVRIAVWTLVAGPIGAVAMLLKQRDAALVQEIKKEQ